LAENPWVIDPEAAIPRIPTERLVLREWREADREPFAAMNADPRVMEHFPSTLTGAESDAMIDRIVARWRRDGHGLWAVERTDDGAFLGFTGLASPTDAPDLPPFVEIGYRFAVPAWGHGYASEAARAAVGWGFEVLGLDEIASWTAASNTRSQAVMRRIGMTHDPADDFDHPRLPEGHRIRRHVLYRLRRPEPLPAGS
jgi:ribosomal-protein-alanine N-acetyltransferase